MPNKLYERYLNWKLGRLNKKILRREQLRSDLKRAYQIQYLCPSKLGKLENYLIPSLESIEKGLDIIEEKLRIYDAKKQKLELLLK